MDTEKLGLLTDPIVYRTFIESADDNYVMARAAWQAHCHYTFWWLSLHAFEKYLKAILLLNGKSSQGYGHDLNRLLTAIATIDNRLTLPKLCDPMIGNLAWHSSKVTAKFISRMMLLGDPSNRYGLYGFSAETADLIAVDQILYWARRHCRPLLKQSSMWDDYENIDHVAKLIDEPFSWRLDTPQLLEAVIDGNRGAQARGHLMSLNRPFDPLALMAINHRRIAANNAAIREWCEDLELSEANSTSIDQAQTTLQWVLDNIQLNKDDRIYIKELLMKYP